MTIDGFYQFGIRHNITIKQTLKKKYSERDNNCDRTAGDRICCSHANHTSVSELDLTAGWCAIFYTLFRRWKSE